MATNFETIMLALHVLLYVCMIAMITGSLRLVNGRLYRSCRTLLITALLFLLSSSSALLFLFTHERVWSLASLLVQTLGICMLLFFIIQQDKTYSYLSRLKPEKE